MAVAEGTGAPMLPLPLSLQAHPLLTARVLAATPHPPTLAAAPVQVAVAAEEATGTGMGTVVRTGGAATGQGAAAVHPITPTRLPAAMAAAVAVAVRALAVLVLLTLQVAAVVAAVVAVATGALRRSSRGTSSPPSSSRRRCTHRQPLQHAEGLRVPVAVSHLRSHLSPLQRLLLQGIWLPVVSR